MAENKQSFILYSDIISTVERLPDDKAGQLFKLILEYVNDRNPTVNDLLLEVAFEPIKLALKRDLKKWENYIEKQRENGKRGGRPKNPSLLEETQKTQAFFEKPKKADSVIVSVIDNVIKNNIEDRKKEFYNSVAFFTKSYSKELLREFYEYWTEHGEKDKKMRFEKETSFNIERRLNRWQANESKFNNKTSGNEKTNNIYTI